MLRRFVSTLATVFLLLVFLVYIFIGWCGLRPDSVSVSRILPSFTVVNTFPLLHTVHACVSHGQCGSKEIGYEFAGPLIEDSEWKTLSIAVIVIGVLGFFLTVASLREIHRSFRFLGIVIAFTLLAALWNPFAFVINTRDAGGSAAGSFWYPLYSIAWALSYVLGYLGIRAKTRLDTQSKEVS